MACQYGKFHIDSIIYDDDKMNIRMEEVAEKIRCAREKRNLSISGLAERANLSVSCISKAETARSSVSLKSLIKIAAALEIPVAELLETEDLKLEKIKKQVEGEEAGYDRLLEQIMENLPVEATEILVDMTKELMRIFRKEWKREEQIDKE